MRNWTFGSKIAAGFAVLVAFSIVIGLVGVVTLHSVVSSKDDVISIDAPLMVRATQMQGAREQIASSFRQYLLSNDAGDLEALRQDRASFAENLAALRSDGRTEMGISLVAAIGEAFSNHTQAVDSVIALRESGADLPTVLAAFEQRLVAPRAALDESIARYLEYRQSVLESSSAEASATAIFAEGFIIATAVAAALLAALVAFLLVRSLNNQIGAAVRHVQSSSAELQAAANQQATGVKEQVTSMNEINTTISELLATSRQIAESAQRVSQIAEETTTAARAGDGTVERASDSIVGIRRQVDLVVSHMLELGKKSQQIGAVLDIVSELAEQTNILSINATIEAAGAGEAGRRFAVVADEIRKLADRVAISAKEIRTLIDDVRSSVNTTVMATETGSKAVDTGSRQFGDVATLFRQIGQLVVTTTEAAREIELSTKQQATAVEQVNVAIATVAQATKETEASAGQTIQTATELATTSRDLMRMVKAQMAA